MKSGMLRFVTEKHQVPLFSVCFCHILSKHAKSSPSLLAEGSPPASPTSLSALSSINTQQALKLKDVVLVYCAGAKSAC